MGKLIKIALDTMGGDFGPEETVAAAVQAASNYNVGIQLVGDKNLVDAELLNYPEAKSLDIVVIPSDGVIHEHEQPAKAFRQKQHSSIVTATKLVASNRSDACVSMGSTGAAMTAAALIFGLMDGIERPALGGPIIGLAPKTIIVDLGTNVDCKPSQLLSFAIIGEVFANIFWNISTPKVGILSVGAEIGKGNKQVKETTELLSSSGLNFIGNIEGNDLPTGSVDVVICDGFVGNIVMKLTEGLGAELSRHITEFLKEVIDPKTAKVLEREIFRVTNPGADFGAGPLLGVNGISFVGHGKSRRDEIASAIATAKKTVERDFINQIQKRLSETLSTLTKVETDER